MVTQRRSSTWNTVEPIAESMKLASMPPCTMPWLLACWGPGRKPRIRRPPSIFSNHGPLAAAKPIASVSSRKPGGMDTRHLRRCPSGDTSQQDQAVADIVGRERGDQPIGPGAELRVGQLFEQELAERGADHR